MQKGFKVKGLGSGEVAPKIGTQCDSDSLLHIWTINPFSVEPLAWVSGVRMWFGALGDGIGFRVQGILQSPPKYPLNSRELGWRL